MGVDGERHSWTLEDVSRSEAEEFARTKYQELKSEAERRAAGLPTGVRFSGLLKRYRRDELPTLAEGARASYRDSLKPLEHFFTKVHDDPSVGKILTAHVLEYLSWRRTHGPAGEKRKKALSNRTLEKDRAVLHRLFEMALRWDLIDVNPVARTDPPQVDGRDPVILTEAQYEALLEKCEHREMLHTYALFLGETGARSESEALWVKWSDLDLEEGFVWIASGRDGHRTKSGEGRWVPLTRRLEERLREHAAQFRLAQYEGRRSPWVFHHPIRRRNAKAGDRIGSMRRAVSTAAEKAELPEEWTKHDLRHRRVTTWLAAGKNPVHVKEAMGHSDLRVTMGYTHLAREHLRALVDEPGDDRERLKELK